VAALGAVIAAVTLVALVLVGGGSGGYEVTAKFINAGQIVKGNPVQTGGTAIGTVKDIAITDDGQADIKLEIDEKYTPLREGTRAAIRQVSQSGIANRYVNLSFPPDSEDVIDDGGRITIDKTSTAVELDELFNTVDAKTRKALQDFLKGNARQFEGAGAEANETFRYLNPALATSSRLFNELTRDKPVLERFLVDSSRLVTALAERRDDLAGLVGNLNQTTRALGDRLGGVDQRVHVVERLEPFLGEARAFAADAEPTVRDLRAAVQRPGRDNDLINFLDTVPRLADIAVEPKRRNGKQRPGAFPQTASGFKDAAPIIAEARPYTTDLLGWFDDFSTTGGGFDALGAYARAFIGFGETLEGPAKRGQYKRCPGSAEEAASDGSNVFSSEEQSRLDCSESARATGNVP